MIAHFILYVRDQARSTRFYSAVLDRAPTLEVPGMTEFSLNGCVLGLMPERGIQRLLGEALPSFAEGESPRAEFYLRVEDPAAFHSRAVRAGARELSPLKDRDWGDVAAYSLDPDGYVLAFAKSVKPGATSALP